MRGGDDRASRVALVLASSSPRRADVLTALEIPFLVDPAHIPEDPRPGEGALAFVERLSVEKARAVMTRHPDAWVLAGDTVVMLDDEVLGKPATEREAVEMLISLAGREHQVATGLALGSPDGTVLAGVDVTGVRFRAFEADTAVAYVATGEPMDKAGAYGIQGKGGALVLGVDGDYFTVMGFPVSLFMDLLDRSGLEYGFGGLTPRTSGSAT